MFRKTVWALAACVCLAVPAAAQAPNDLLDVFTVRVKQDKGAQFDAAAKKIVAANRQNNGTNWVAAVQVYGSGQVVRFVSIRANFAAIEKDNETFMGAMIKTYGQSVAEQIFRDADSYMESSQTEVRRRRWDLSANVPSDPGAVNKLIGESRWVQTVMVRVRPGHGPHFEEQLRAIKAAQEKAEAKVTTLVSQAAFGQNGTVYYISTPRKSLAEIDSAVPLPQLLGAGGYEQFLKTTSEAVLTTEFTISRYAPEFSNPPQGVAAAAPEFWNPKPAAKKPAAKKPE
jgi:hypothetical protein